MSLRAVENAGNAPAHAHGHNGHGAHHGAAQPLNVQFEDIDQQNECYIVGMWAFLVQEIMFFGALFLAYSIYRTLYFSTYLDAHHFLNVWLGATNTAVLLTSSLSMALAVWAAQEGRKWMQIICITITIVFSFAFLGIKYIEYSSKINEGLFPGKNFDYAKALRMHAEEEAKSGKGGGEQTAAQVPQAGGKVASGSGGQGEMHSEAALNERGGTVNVSDNPASFDYTPNIGFNAHAAAPTENFGAPVITEDAHREEVRGRRAQLFFSIYFTMTGLHGIHVLVGIIMMVILIYMRWTDHIAVRDYMTTEMIGLYWHFVDIVWIFLFPLMYLIS